MENLIGKTLSNRYRIDESLGRGGMAEVFKAWDQERATFLALKVLRQDLARDQIFLRRFQREAHTLEKLQHPNIVRFFGIETDDLSVFMLMDFIEGTTLQDEIFRSNRKPLNADFISLILESVCSALYFAHNQGLVHCDIKPGNIMIDKSGRVLLTDFGIARMTDAATSTMVGFGTPAYMAPELVRGQDPTPQSDIYSLGILLYEMVTGGERPFTGERSQTTGMTSEKVRWEHLHLAPNSPKLFNPDISQDLEAAILRCLEKDPSNRYNTALELLNAVNIGLGKSTTVDPVQNLKQIIPDGKQENPERSLKRTPLLKGKPATFKLPAWAPIGIVILGVMIILGIVIIFGVVLRLVRAGSGKTEIAAKLPIATETMTRTPVTSDTQTPIPTETPTPTEIPTLTETATVTLVPTQTILVSGLTMINPVDNTTLVSVPEGDFIMGSQDWDATVNETPERFVFLDSFWIYKTEVTNSQYRLCIQEGVCSGSLLTYQENNEPAVNITWFQANDYCEWAGGRLPTEAEWEKAARGTDGRKYPWEGNIQPDCTLANFSGCGNKTMPVGSHPSGASPYGALDMAGNVREWVADWWEDFYYRHAHNRNPQGPTSGSLRVIRGGSWYQGERHLRTSSRHAVAPSYSGNYNGFRCVQTHSE